VVAVIYGFLNIKIAPLEDEQVIAVEPA